MFLAIGALFYQQHSKKRSALGQNLAADGDIFEFISHRMKKFLNEQTSPKAIKFYVRFFFKQLKYDTNYCK